MNHRFSKAAPDLTQEPVVCCDQKINLCLLGTCQVQSIKRSITEPFERIGTSETGGANDKAFRCKSKQIESFKTYISVRIIP